MKHKKSNIVIEFDNELKKHYSNCSILRGLIAHTVVISDNSVISNKDNQSTNFQPNDTKYIENNNIPEFTKNINGWNIAAAVNWIINNSYPYYIKGKCGKCAKYVRSAIDVGFNTNPNGNDSYTGKRGRPVPARLYVNFLPKIGFKHLCHVTKETLNLYTPQPGDIAVYKKNGSNTEAGHICMWSGKQWISDFKQNSIFVYEKTNEGDIFRFEE